YGTEYLELSFSQVAMLVSLASFVRVILEVPTGSWADRFGRKKIFVVGTALYVFSIAVYVLTKDINVLVLGQIVGGFGSALTSGTLAALIYDTLVEDGKEDMYISVNSNKQTYLFISRASAAILSGFIYGVDPRLPYILMGIFYTTTMFLGILLHEPEYTKPDSLSDFSQIKDTIKYLIANRKIVFFLTILSGFILLANMLFVMYQPFFDSTGLDKEIIGFIYLVAFVISAIGSQVIKKIVAKLGYRKILVIMFLATITAALLFLSQIAIFGVMAVAVISIILGFQNTVEYSYLNSKLPSNIRATGLSILEMMKTLAFVIALNLAGSISDSSFGLVGVYIFVISGIVVFFFTLFLVKFKKL
ncbi:MFS transporter, partial [Candidatus Dojkabacteria bacterium]|nr:MFS transporter [Candidatus Dojkabacteria bacterium]